MNLYLESWFRDKTVRKFLTFPYEVTYMYYMKNVVHFKVPYLLRIWIHRINVIDENIINMPFSKSAGGKSENSIHQQFRWKVWGRGVWSRRFCFWYCHNMEGMHVSPPPFGPLSPGSAGPEKTCKVQIDLKPQYRNVTWNL